MDPVIKTGTPAPDFTLTDLDGTPHSLADTRGRVTILVFWSAECPWSARADETLKKMKLAWGEEVIVLAIAANANESREEKAEAAAERGVSPLLLDEGGEVARLYGAKITPQVFLIEGGGSCATRGHSMMPTSASRSRPATICGKRWNVYWRMRIPSPARCRPTGVRLSCFNKTILIGTGRVDLSLQ